MARTADTSLGTHQRLAWAYLDRMAAGDYVKASAVLSMITRIYPATYREVAGLVTPGREGAYPPTIQPSWGGNTSAFIGIVLDAFFRAAGDQARSDLAANIDDQAAVNVGPYARGLLDGARGSVAAFVQPIADADMGALPATIDRLVAQSLDPSAASSSSTPQVLSQFATRVLANPALQQSIRQSWQQTPVSEGGGDAVTPLPPMTIVGRAASPGLPTWGWWVIGAIAVSGIGYGVYRMTR